MIRNLFVDTSLRDMTESERKKNTLNVQSDMGMGKIKKVALSFLRIPNYILSYQPLNIQCEFLNDHFVSRRNGNSKCFALIIPQNSSPSTVTMNFCSSAHDIRTLHSFENSDFVFPNRMPISQVFHQDAYSELLLHSVILSTPQFYAKTLITKVDNTGVKFRPFDDDEDLNLLNLPNGELPFHPSVSYTFEFKGHMKIEIHDEETVFDDVTYQKGNRKQFLECLSVPEVKDTLDLSELTLKYVLQWAKGNLIQIEFIPNSLEYVDAMLGDCGVVPADAVEQNYREERYLNNKTLGYYVVYDYNPPLSSPSSLLVADDDIVDYSSGVRYSNESNSSFWIGAAGLMEEKINTYKPNLDTTGYANYAVPGAAPGDDPSGIAYKIHHVILGQFGGSNTANRYKYTNLPVEKDDEAAFLEAVKLLLHVSRFFENMHILTTKLSIPAMPKPDLYEPGTSILYSDIPSAYVLNVANKSNVEIKITFDDDLSQETQNDVPPNLVEKIETTDLNYLSVANYDKGYTISELHPNVRDVHDGEPYILSLFPDMFTSDGQKFDYTRIQTGVPHTLVYTLYFPPDMFKDVKFTLHFLERGDVSNQERECILKSDSEMIASHVLYNGSEEINLMTKVTLNQPATGNNMFPQFLLGSDPISRSIMESRQIPGTQTTQTSEASESITRTGTLGQVSSIFTSIQRTLIGSIQSLFIEQTAEFVDSLSLSSPQYKLVRVALEPNKLVRINKGKPVRFQTKFRGITNNVLPIMEVGPSTASLIFDVVDYSNLKLQDLFYTRPLVDADLNLNNLNFSFFTGDGRPYPIFTQDDAIFEFEFEGM